MSIRILPHSMASGSAGLGNGTELAFYDSWQQEPEKREKQEEEPVIVLLHGFCGSSAYWREVVPELEQTGRVVAPDLRGHGASSAPPDEVYDMERMAEDIKLLLDKLEIRTAWLFGHSLGGYITLAFAEKYAGLLNGYGLIHSTAWPDSDEAKRNRDKAVETIQTAGIRTFVDGLIPKLFAPAHVRSMPDKVAQAVQIGYETAAHGAAATARGMKQRTDRRSQLLHSRLPLLLLAGEEDGVIAPDKTFAAEGAHVSRVLLKQAGHMSMMEDPGACAAQIAAFVSGR